MRTSIPVGLGLVAALLCGACTERPVAITGSLRGTLTTTRGAPLFGGTIRLSGGIETAFQTGSDGTFRFDRLPVGEYLVAATADDTLEGVTTRLVQVTGGAGDDAAVELSLTGVGKVRGKVTLEDEPLGAGTQIAIGGSTQRTLTGVDGGFVVERVPEGKVSLFAVHDGWEPSPLGSIELARGEERTVDAVLLKKTSTLTTTLTGKTTVPGATDHGGVVVTIAGTHAMGTSTADGSFTIDQVPVGIVTLELRRGLYTSVVAPIWVTSTAPPLVMAREPYVLPTIDLTFGERIAAPNDGVGTPTSDGKWLVTSTALYTVDVAVSATERATGVRHTLEHSALLQLHPDGMHVLALQYTNLPGLQQSLVSWDPVSGNVTTLEPDVEQAEYLASRNEIFVRRPALKLVSLTGGATRVIGDASSVGATTTFDTLGKTMLLSGSYADATWIDLDTNTTIFSANNTTGVMLAPNGAGILLSEEKLMRYRSRAGATTTISTDYYAYPTISPDGHYLSYAGAGTWHLYDLQALHEIATYATSSQAGYAFTPDSQSFIGIRDTAAGGTEITIFDLPSGAAHPPLVFDKKIYGSWIKYEGRRAYVSIDNGDTTARLEQIDLTQATKRVLVEHLQQLSVLRPDAIFYTVREDNLAVGKRLALDVADATPLSFPGFPWAISEGGMRVIGRTTDSFTYTNLATGKQVVLVAGHDINNVDDLRATFLDETHVQVRRYVDSYSAMAAPALQVGEGLYVGAPDEVQP